MLMAEGYDIGEAYWADHVELYGTAQQARRLMLRGFRVKSMPLPPHGGFSIPDDFPPGFEDYHNYAEMTANLQALAAAHPQFVRLITLGNSFENGTSSACASRTTRTTICPSRASSSSASITRAST